jgi:hypothetical protein
MDQRFNIWPETLRLLQERVGDTLGHIDNNFLNRTPMAQQLRERIDNGTT